MRYRILSLFSGPVVALFIALPIMFWILWQSIIPVVQIKDEIINSPKVGEDAIVVTRVLRKKLCGSTSERMIIDGAGRRWILPPYNFTSPPGPLGEHETRQNISIPDGAIPGPSVLFFSLSWSCSAINYLIPLRDTISIPFVIAPGKVNGPD